MTQLISEQTSGVYIIAATPFAEDGSIDYASIDTLVEFYINHGVSGLTVLGMMGEAPKLSAEEQLAVAKHYIDRVGGRVPVMIGVSSAGLNNLVALSQRTMDFGAAGVMIAPTPGLGTDEKLIGYFSSAIEALGSEIPVCYQDYPQTTGVHISVSCLNQMIADFPSLVMFKHEDCPGLGKLSQIIETSKTDDVRRVSILCGNGGLYLPQEMMRGADGAMTGFAFPEMLVQVIDMFRADDNDAAEDLFDAYLPLARHEQQPGFGLAIRKETLRLRGAISTATTRKPGPTASNKDLEELSRLMTRLERRLEEMK
ncbi:dihydrodipicolinate synthase family protein [Rhodospirillales bacterium]|nr:dihydrodipicolinate synthase family protein [Rhodospirillales bacterium]